jgi:hypothetical protein
MDNIDEFLSPNFHKAMMMGFEFLLLLTISIFIVSRRRLNFIEFGLVMTFTHLALYSARYIPLFSIIVAPILARHAESILKESSGRLVDFVNKSINNATAVDAFAKGYVWAGLAVVAIIIVANNGTLEHKFDEKEKPVAAVEFLKKEGLKGNMFNNDEFGDYIIYSAFPQYKVFIDDRIGTPYDVGRVKEYLRVRHLEAGWEEIIEKYSINWIIFNTSSMLSRHLAEKKEWKLIYFDKVASIFVRNIFENQVSINEYADFERGGRR